MIVKPDTYQALFGEQVTEESVSWWLTGGINPANCVAAYQPVGAASLAASYVNLANPGTYDAAPGVAPSWDAVNGWTFNGSNQYLDSGVVLAAGYAVFVQYTNADTVTSGRPLAGLYDGGNNRFWISAYITINVVRYYYGSGQWDRAPGLTAGNLGLIGNQGYRNGVTDGAAGAVVFASNTKTMHIGQVNGFAGVGFYKGNIQALAIYNTDISAYVAALTTAMAAL